MKLCLFRAGMLGNKITLKPVLEARERSPGVLRPLMRGY